MPKEIQVIEVMWYFKQQLCLDRRSRSSLPCEYSHTIQQIFHQPVNNFSIISSFTNYKEARLIANLAKKRNITISKKTRKNKGENTEINKTRTGISQGIGICILFH